MKFIRLKAAIQVIDLINSTGYYKKLSIEDIKGIDLYGLADEDEPGWPLVACAAIIRQGPQAYLDYLSVRLENRKQGLSVLLLERVRAKLKKQGVGILHACVSGENGAAIKLATKHKASIGFPFINVHVNLEAEDHGR